MIRWALHRLPLMSGLGRLANSPLGRRLTASESTRVWAVTRSGDLLVSGRDWVGRTILLFGDLDPKITAIIRRFVRPGDVALDVGSNFGLYALALSRRVGETGRVHAFEPNPFLVEYISETKARNGLDNLIVRPFALGATRHRTTLWIPAGNLGQASLSERAASGMRVNEAHEVEVRDLDGLAAEEGLDRLNFVKIDVEGF